MWTFIEGQCKKKANERKILLMMDILLLLHQLELQVEGDNKKTVCRGQESAEDWHLWQEEFCHPDWTTLVKCHARPAQYNSQHTLAHSQHTLSTLSAQYNSQMQIEPHLSHAMSGRHNITCPINYSCSNTPLIMRRSRGIMISPTSLTSKPP